MLTEAAEIEHNLLCSYLYAAFSFRRGVEEGLSPEEAGAVARWRKLVVSVALEEMSHLALVNNLLVAVGGSPHFDRPNFPVPPGYHPAGFSIRLTPFDADTLQHFLFLERPAGAPVEDGGKFAGRGAAARRAAPTRVTPSSEDYETIGELYDLIGHQLEALVRQRGGSAFHDASVERQLGPELVKLPGLAVVRNLEDALSALRRIVEQGEGARAGSAESHFARFGRIEEEWRGLLEADPQFRPAHPAAHDPVMRAPAGDAKRVWITEPRARERVDLANAVYGTLISVLCQLYVPARREIREALVACALSLMHVLTELGEALARLPAHPQRPGVNAGLTFASPRNVGPRGTPALIAERLLELSVVYSELGDRAGSANPITAAATRLAAAAG